MPQVSVIIPAYNPDSFLLTALQSVQSQTFHDWEAVVVDDGGVEDISWIDAFDSRVRRVRQDNAGTSAARNTGVRLSGGPLLAFLDQDDLWLPGKLERQVSFMAATGARMTDTSFRIFRGSKTLSEYGYRNHHGSYAKLLYNARIGLSTLMVSREVAIQAGLFNPLLKIMQDWDFALRIAALGFPFKRVPEVLAAYRVHESNTSQDYWLGYKEALSIYAQHATRAVSLGRTEVAGAVRNGVRDSRRLHALQGIDAFRGAFHAGNLPVAARHLVRVFRISPGIGMHALNSGIKDRLADAR